MTSSSIGQRALGALGITLRMNLPYRNARRSKSLNPDQTNSDLIIIFNFTISVFVKQEPEDQHMKRQMQHAVVASAALAAAGQNNVNAGYVSSTTHMNGYNLPNRPVNGQPNAGKT